ncbi:coiled-coil domain-containing protein 74B isoform X2 [Alosa alosa]|uniref:coiled-coil domain-containing protein 74B isoform X2 n=1 Tax=Alosa alosa TaxID=278164 RepID=UPI0020151316|nr:coiled-coil domain-containing protein 74B isoform X2 [Alosa alosa]
MLNTKVPPLGKGACHVKLSATVIVLDGPCHTILPSTPTRLSGTQLPKLSPRGEDAGVPPGPAFSDADMRVASLERDIQFLQQQHRHTLHQLHAEIDSLKSQNKELQFKLIMEPLKSYRKVLMDAFSTGSSYRGQRPQPEGQRFLPDRGIILEQDPSTPQEKTGVSGTENPAAVPSESAEGPKPSKQGSRSELMGGLITSLQPLMIQCSPSQPPRPPTLQECEVLIRQLYNANSLQSQEILHIKAVLRDIIFSRKITPENYIITKAYLSSGDRAGDTARFPNLPFRQLQKRLPVSQASVAKRVILPALRQSQGTSVAERQRRAQAVRGHLKRTVHKDSTQRATAALKHPYQNFNTG